MANEWENGYVNRAEIGNRIADFIWGKKFEGTVAAILPSEIINSSRYVVTTGEEVLDVHVPAIENHGIFPYSSYIYHPPLERGNQISSRAVRNVRPWVDGQNIYFGV